MRADGRSSSLSPSILQGFGNPDEFLMNQADGSGL
jgi:hypothetical protein